MKTRTKVLLEFGAFILILLFVSVEFVTPTHAERGGNPPGVGQVVSRDPSSTNIPASYGSAGASFATSVSGKSHVKVINNSAADLGISLGTTTTNCSGGVDNDVVPANGASATDFIFVNSTVCIRSLSGGAVSSATKVYLVLWWMPHPGGDHVLYFVD